jgi:hypothetical protein
MDKELLNDSLRVLLNTFKESKDFVLEQAPDIVQQLIMYTIVERLVLVILGIIILSILPIILWKIYVKYNKDVIDAIKEIETNTAPRYVLSSAKVDPFEYVVTGVLSSLFVGFPGFFLISNNLQTLLKAWIAPKIFIIEYISDLL